MTRLFALAVLAGIAYLALWVALRTFGGGNLDEPGGGFGL